MYYPIDVKALKEMADKQAIKEAEARANNLKENYPGWKDKLPDCPCTEEEIEQSDEFESANFGLETHHPGAASGYRSSEPVEIKSSVNPKLPELEAGQQCTFDRKGDLITHGEGAGTPDAYSPSELSNVLDHYRTDVYPSKHLNTGDYQKQWTPNNDNNCPENWGDKVTKLESETKPENRQPGLDSKLKSDSPENTQSKTEINSKADTELQTNNEEEAQSNEENKINEFESFIDETSSEDRESFLESDSFEIESFAEASSESYESFSDSSPESFESFSESSTEMASESYSEYSSEMG